MLPIIGAVMLVGLIGATHPLEAKSRELGGPRTERHAAVESESLPAQPIEPAKPVVVHKLDRDPVEKAPRTIGGVPAERVKKISLEYYPESGPAPEEAEEFLEAQPEPVQSN